VSLVTASAPPNDARYYWPTSRNAGEVNGIRRFTFADNAGGVENRCREGFSPPSSVVAKKVGLLGGAVPELAKPDPIDEDMS